MTRLRFFVKWILGAGSVISSPPSNKSRKLFRSVISELQQKSFKRMIPAVSAPIHAYLSPAGFAKASEMFCSRNVFPQCRPCYQYVAMFASFINKEFPESSRKHNLVYLVISTLFSTHSLSTASWIRVILEIFSLTEVADEFSIFQVWLTTPFKL